MPSTRYLHLPLEGAYKTRHLVTGGRMIAVGLAHAGEITADEGDAAICGRSVRGDLHAAQQHTGYCPQFDGLPGLMTGE
jgi:hypothetical protein